MANKRILIFSTAYLPFVGGSEFALKETTDRLKGYSFDLITSRFRKDLPAVEQIGNVTVYRVGFGNWLDKFLLPVLGYIEASKLQAENNYDFIHSYQASQGGFAAYLFKRQNPSLPLVVTLQEGKDLDGQFFLIKLIRKKILSIADKVTVISNYLGDYAEKNNVRPDNILLIPNGVDMEKFSKQYTYGELEELKNKLGIRPYDKVIVSSSRLVKKNNLESLINAVAILRKMRGDLDIKLLIIGDGYLKDKLKAMVSDLNLETNISFIGEVPHKKLPIFLHISHLFVRPSLSEGLGTAFLEAMAAGLPIVATKVGGIPDFLKDNETGLFCGLDPQSVADRIYTLLINKELRHSVSVNSVQLIEEKYTWDKISSKMEELYNTI